MIRKDLRDFIESAIDGKYISAEDIEKLRQDILREGLSSRAEAEALLALDRTVETHESWGAALTALIVDFVVRSSRGAGEVTGSDALWLVTALDVGGPTRTGLEIAYAVLERKSDIDGALLDFIMRARQQARLESLAA